MKPLLFSLLVFSVLITSCNQKPYQLEELATEDTTQNQSSQSADSSFLEYPGIYIGTTRLLHTGSSGVIDTTYADTVIIGVMPGDSFTVRNFMNPNTHSTFVYNNSDFYEYTFPNDEKRVWVYPGTDSIIVEQVIHYSLGAVRNYRFKGKRL